MLFNFHSQFADETSRKNKYKFESWLQEGVEFTSDYTKKLNPPEYYQQIVISAGFKILGTHAKVQNRVVPAGHNTYFCECLTCGVVRRIAFGYLQKNTVNCFVCFINRLSDEAEQHGLKLIGPSKDGDTKRRHYLFSCGHSRDIATGDVRCGQFSCMECFRENLEESFRFLNIENLGRPDTSYGVDTTQYYRIKHQVCGHERLALQTQILSRSIGTCTECYEADLKERVELLHDVTLVDKHTETKRTIRFNKCGHEKKVSLSNLKSGSFQCTTCQEEKFKKDALEVGLIYIGPDAPIKGEKRKHVYLADCGHNILSRPSHIRTGHWTCRKCDSGYLDRPNKLYIFKICTKGFEFIKVGYSQKPEYRKYDYKTDDDAIFDLVKTVTIPTGREVITIENDLHRKYKNWNYPSSLMKEYIYESGFTECYPLNLLETFLKEFESIERELGNE